MAIKFKVVKQAFGFDKEKTEKYVLRVVNGEVLEFDKLCNQVTQMCGAHRGTVKQVIGGMFDVMAVHIDMGNGIQMGEFGTLRPALRTRAQDSEEKANATAVYRRKINFTPGKMLKNFLSDLSVTRVSSSSSSTNKQENGESGEEGNEAPQ